MIYLALFVILVLQAAATLQQVRQYKKTVRRLCQLGSVGIGSKKGKLAPGNIVVIACDQDGRITGGEILEGYTILSRFQALQQITGKTIYELHDEYQALPAKQQKAYKAHLQALEALILRLNTVEA
ncbi:glucitol operon activator protein [Propionispora hippei DSM 15287]|uniref:Glucitol operon activator protein n=2 Tax=Propionispora TaxID=112902 RepID=A0A1M6EZA2_9FIRM|nr:glucitol operon activator protein [Propionispora hippei DSM 15287]